MYHVPGPRQYLRRLLPPSPTVADVMATVPDYAAMLSSIMAAIADRYERRADYPYLDTKLSTITGEDFAEGDPLRGRGSIYGWIQGRGLESLADHCRWLRSHPEMEGAENLRRRLERIMAEVLANLRSIRAVNGGHIYFLMTPEGAPFTLVDDRRKEAANPDPSQYSFSDLFSAKGMYAAATYLGDRAAAAEALQYCLAVDQSIHEGRFYTNEREGITRPARSDGDARPLGPYLIHLGTAAVLTEGGEFPDAVEMGLRLFRHALAHHVNLGGRLPELREGDIWEQIDRGGGPYRQDGMIQSNPGHSLEFVGLGLKFTRAARRSPWCTSAQRSEIERVEAAMPTLLARNFDNGFLLEAGGICQYVDLLTRRPLSEIMPWWSLPETVRAAMLSWEVGQSEEQRRECLRVLSGAHNGFAQHYVRADLHLMAYQTRSTAGVPVHVIPATPDADPGYHTGSSILDFLRLLDELPARD